MPRETKQKGKLIYIAEALYRYTDENHCMSSQDIIDYLAEREIFVERKTVFSDITTLKDCGLDIGISRRKDSSGYYLISRDFELPELKLMTEAVLSSRYITTKKSKQLIDKLANLASPSDRASLKREVFVSGRVKTENESIYYIVDELHTAMSENCEITFRYLTWSPDKTLVPRHNGKIYRVSPWALTVKDENYYLVAYDDEVDEIRHYRVDKMSQIEPVPKSKRKGKEQFTSFDIGEYAGSSFGMFRGESRVVSLAFPEIKIGIILDRFGTKINTRTLPDGRISARVSVLVSPQFFGWIAGLGPEIEIRGPEDVRKEYADYLKSLLAAYET